MALQTGRHRNVKIMLPDSNRILKGTRSELQSMHKTIIHFIKILKVNVFGSVTGITSCHFVMGTLVPALVLIAHDMTVYAGLRIIQQVRVTLTVNEGERTKPKGKATNRQQDNNE